VVEPAIASGMSDGRTLTDGQTLSDDELVTVWGLVLEGTSRLGATLAGELDQAVGLSATWAEVLFRLRRTPEHYLPTTQLAHAVSFSSGGFTKLLDHLVGAGLVERVPCPTDRRVIYAALTPLGQARADAALKVHAESLRRHVLGTLGPDRLGELAQTMRRLRDG
jgi:DNA-binding MarR family transcriptional regulator